MTGGVSAGFWPGVVRLWRFDLRRVRVLAAVVVVLELLRAAFVEWSLHYAPVALDGGFGSEMGRQEFELLDVGLWATMAIGTALLVQLDHPGDDRAFWRSRPISAWQLGIAKLTLLAGLFVALPAAVNAVRLAAYSAPPSAFGAATLQIGVTAGWIIVPCAALALATRTLAAFLGTTAGLVVALLLIARTGVPYLPEAARLAIAGTYPRPAGVALDWQRVAIHGWLGGLVATSLGLAVLALHYRHRRIGRTVGALLVLCAGAIAWPRLERGEVLATAWATRVGDRIQLAGNMTLSRPRTQTTPDAGQSLGGRLESLPLPNDVSAAFVLRQLELRGAGWAIRPSFAMACCDEAFTAATLAAAAGEPVASADTAKGIIVVGLTAGEADRVRNQTVDVDGALGVQLTRHRLVGELPLRAGVAFRTSEYVIELLAVDGVRRTALCRLVRFPSLTVPTRTRLSLFVRTRATGVEPSLRWWQLEPGGTDGVAADGGRNWVRRVTLPLLDAVVPGSRARLLIVESTSLGALDTRLAARGVTVKTATLSYLE